MCRPWVGWPVPVQKAVEAPPPTDPMERTRVAFKTGGLPAWYKDVRPATEVEAAFGVACVLETKDAGVIGFAFRYHEESVLPLVPIALQPERLRDWFLQTARAERRRRLTLWQKS